MANLDDPPAAGEIEVSIFGPGKGESIAVHLGDSRWIIVDSCRERGTGRIPAISYLQRIGVDLARDVDLVVATHAHDDHFAGIADIFAACEGATFVCSSAATSEEFLALVEIDAEIEQILRESAYSEYRKVFGLVERRIVDGGRGNTGSVVLKRALEQLPLLLRGSASDNSQIRVTALSPSHRAVTRAQTALARGLGKVGERRRLAMVDPNEFAVALWIEASGKTVLLGADLPVGPAGCGWAAVLDSHSPESRAEVFKVPHHGAPNAHHQAVWDDLLCPDPVALIAPYRAGRTPRPSADDRSRICGLTQHAYITASARQPASSNSIRRVAATMSPLARNVRDPWGTCGHVRARAAGAEATWDVQVVPPARHLAADA